MATSSSVVSALPTCRVDEKSQVYSPTGELLEGDELDIIQDLLEEQYHILISGPAGSGKSHLLRRLQERLIKQWPTLRLEVTAPTGVTAFNSGGVTVHRRLGLGLATESTQEILQMLKQRSWAYPKTLSFLRDTEVWIIDEISMMDPALFQKIIELFQLVRTSKSPPVLLIMFGDFTQLGPVVKKNDTYRSVLHTPAWKQLKLHRLYLDRNFRQQHDHAFIQLLNRVRFGQVSAEDCKLLQSRIVAPPEHLNPVHIFCRKDSVEETNQRYLAELEKQGHLPHTYQPFLRIEDIPDLKVTARDSKEEKQFEQFIKRAWCGVNGGPRDDLPVFEVQVCIGAQVMMRCNRYIDQGVYNGSIGTVQSVTEHEIIVYWKKSELQLSVSRYPFIVQKGNTCQVVMRQFPLSLAWASTIHKVQGLTLPEVLITPKDCFEPGQFYVALSRAQRLEDVYLTCFQPKECFANTNIVEFESYQPPSSSSSLSNV